VESLALASIGERRDKTFEIRGLPALDDITSDEQKIGLARAWLSQWSRGYGAWFQHTPADWYGREVRGHSGNFKSIDRWLLSAPARKSFKKDWLPVLLAAFCAPVQGKHRLIANHIRLEIGGNWAYCAACKSTQRPIEG